MSSDGRSYEQYRAALIARHQTALADRISVVGDAMLLVGIGLLAARRFRAAGLTYAAAISVEVAAHFFQSGTVVEEVREVALHPIWAARAETYRVFRTKRPSRP